MGAYSDYKQEEDLLRWEATPQAGPFLEYLDYRVLPLDAEQHHIVGWERLRIMTSRWPSTPGPLLGPNWRTS